MGKSTFVKHLVLDIINSTIKIPIFLELRRIEESETLLQRMAKDIDESQTGVDEKLLLMLLDQGGFIIVLDGYDELPNQLRKKVDQQITEIAVRCDQNSLILTSRPEVNLPEIPKSKAFTINRLKKKQAESIALRYDNIVNLEIGKQLIKQFDRVNENFLETPLFIALLYKTYGFNQSIATKITSFYDDVFNAFYKGHDLTKSGFAREKASKLDAENFRRLLRGFSFLLIAQQKNDLKSKTEGISIIEEAIKLTSVIPTNAEDFFDDLLLTIPLIIKDGTDFRFIHKSIGEFFAAEFLAFTSNSQKIIEKIRDGKSYKSFLNSLEYLSEINPNLFKKLIVAPLAKAVLKEKRYKKDQYLQSINFIKKVYIGIHEDRKLAVNETNINIFVGPLEFRGENRKKYYISVRESKIRQTPLRSAWKLISKRIEDLNFESVFNKKDGGFKLAGLEKILPHNKLLTINSKILSSNVEHPSIRNLFFIILWLEPFSGDSRFSRVLDNIACRDVLDEIKREIKTHEWVSSLMSDK